MMTADDVLAFVRIANEASIEVWLDGGWCVDALVGTQTREHDDLDIAVPIEHRAQLRNALTSIGFTLQSETADNPVFSNSDERRIDVHFFDRSVRRENDDGREVFSAIAYPVDAFGATGMIDGEPVPCCTAEFLMYAHSCYAPDTNDIADMRVLNERLGTELLPPFTP